MPYDIGAAVSRNARLTANSGVKAFGASIDTDELDGMSSPTCFGVPRRAVSLWFGAKFRNGMFPARLDGTSLSDYIRDARPSRQVSAFLLGYPGGIAQVGLYSGKSRLYEIRFDTLGESFRWFWGFLRGGLDDSTGYAWSAAWFRADIVPEQSHWLCRVWFNSAAPGECSP